MRNNKKAKITGPFKRYIQEEMKVKNFVLLQLAIYLNQLLIITSIMSKDFEGMFKYKLILPFFIILSIIMMAMGPLYQSPLSKYFSLFIFGWGFYKTVSGLFVMVRAIIITNKIFKKVESKYYDKIQQTKQRSQIYYGIVIPNYKEQIQVLNDTLQVLAKHKRAKKRYLIFLAMEKNEEGSDIKAQKLQKRYKNQFKAIQFTVHVLQPGQQAGKAANTNWCIQRIQPILEKCKIQHQKLFLTIIDVDSWAPQPYFEELQQNLIDQPQQRHKSIYMPPQIYTRNNLQVSIITRVSDTFLSLIHMTNLYSCFSLTFPLSNYTVSYSLLKRIGFWDTCADAIGEDFHMLQKAFWKTDGDIIAKPIYVSFNHVGIETNNGFVANVLARFWQAERHCQGCADMAYCTKNLFEKKFKWINVVLFLIVSDNYLMSVVAPFPIYSAIFFKLFVPEQYRDHTLTPICDLIIIALLQLTGVINLLLALAYEFFKRKTNKKIYKRQNEGLWTIVQYQIILSLIIFGLLAPTSLIAAFRVLKNNRQYHRADKKSLPSNIKVEDEQKQQLKGENQ